MPDSLISFALQLVYLFNHITVAQVLDILLVTVVFFVVFQALHQTRTLQMLRGVIIFAILGVALLVLLPFDTLGWLVRLVLLAGAIALPLLFQDELRRLLIGLGQFGRRRDYLTNFQRFKEVISSAVWDLSSRAEGALIVLEGQTPLEDMIGTGIPLQAEVLTAELLQTIFFPKTPLHDGAVILRGDRLVAASCILPVQTDSTGDTHLGTRHRAALGLTEKVPDALVIVVSEETGRVSVAYAGKLYMGLTPGQLNDWLVQFGQQSVGSQSGHWGWLRGGGWKSTLRNLITAVVLAVIAWLSVTFQTNPPAQSVIEGVPVTVSGPDQGMLLMSELPATVKVRVQTTKDRLDGLDNTALRAEVFLDNLSAGVHNAPIQVTAADPYVQVIQVKPSSAGFTLDTQTTLVLTPTVSVQDLQSLPPGYVVGQINLSPQTVRVTGPKSKLDEIRSTRVDISLNGQRADFQETIAPILLDEKGQVLIGLPTVPDKILATVPVGRTFFTREVAVQAMLDKSKMDANYEITSIQVVPQTVMLAGSNDALSKVKDYLETAPVDLENVYSDLKVEVPLKLPADVSALNAQGDRIITATVQVGISPLTDYLVLDEWVVIAGQPLTATVKITPARVSALLIGPKPLLAGISKNVNLVSVSVDLAGLTPGTYTLPLRVVAPPGVKVQLFPSEVKVVIE
jgi:diadenylate cyclase